MVAVDATEAIELAGLAEDIRLETPTLIVDGVTTAFGAEQIYLPVLHTILMGSRIFSAVLPGH
jgi:hypothetical protein